jgi:uncharacterized protein
LRHARLIREADGTILVPEVEVLASLGQRLKGLLGQTSLEPGRAVWLSPCGSIHTFFMRFDLDLIFLGGDFRVVRLVRGVRPWRMVAGGLRARGVVEMQSGWFPAAALKAGDRVRLAE